MTWVFAAMVGALFVAACALGHWLGRPRVTYEGRCPVCGCLADGLLGPPEWVSDDRQDCLHRRML